MFCIWKYIFFSELWSVCPLEIVFVVIGSVHVHVPLVVSVPLVPVPLVVVHAPLAIVHVKLDVAVPIVVVHVPLVVVPLVVPVPLVVVHVPTSIRVTIGTVEAISVSLSVRLCLSGSLAVVVVTRISSRVVVCPVHRPAISPARVGMPGSSLSFSLSRGEGGKTDLFKVLLQYLFHFSDGYLPGVQASALFFSYFQVKNVGLAI